ncbi:MAG TPA: hypothetical protein VFS43_38330 [Polyangiaceae bacterium]|nr:hypothetical protein [Polyangiaceae bacterium]
MAAIVPGTRMPLPEGWPEFGDLDGEPVRLADVESTLPFERWCEVVAKIGGKTVRPWRFVSFKVVDDAGNVVGGA